MNMWLIALFGGAASLVLGSFVGALAYRLPRAERLRDVLQPSRSHCPACDTTLSARELVPVLSYLWSRARCTHCGAKISPDYVIAEAGTLAAFLAAFSLSVEPTFWLIFTVFGAILLLIALVDLRDFFIPDEAVIALCALWVLDAVSMQALPIDPQDSLIAGLSAAAILFGLRFIFQQWRGVDALGLGDVKLAFALGFFIGWQSLGLFFALAAFLTLAAIALTRAQMDRAQRIPFAPGLCASAATILLLTEAKLLPL